MLISHEYRFIFIKTRKTAGTSIEVELAKIMADRDVVTPIRPVQEGHRPRNFRRQGETFTNHMPAVQISAALGPELFGSYFKFTVEREPVDKCVSHYSMLRNSPDHNEHTRDMTWADYVARGVFPVDHKKYLDSDGTLMVNRLLKYERLEEDLAAVAAELGLPFDRLSTRAKAGFREEPGVTARQRAIIYDAFSPSCAVTGYRRDVPVRL